MSPLNASMILILLSLNSHKGYTSKTKCSSFALLEFNVNNIKIIDACSGDLRLRFAESIYLKHSKQTLNTKLKRETDSSY